MSSTADLSEIDGLLMTPEFLEDPYPVYQRIREAEPVHFIAPFNAWIVTRMEDLKTAYADDRFGVIFDEYQINRIGPEAVDHDYYVFGKEFLVCSDPPLHTKLKRIFRQPFTPKRVGDLTPTVTRRAYEILDDLAGKDTLDLVGEYSGIVPLAVMNELLDIPGDEDQMILSWVSAFYSILEIGPMSPDQLVAADDASRGAMEYFGALVRQRREHPGDDFVSDLVKANAEDEEPMTEEQLVANLFLLYFAGFDTQKLNFGNMIAALDKHPDQLRWLQEDPSRVDGAMNELYRYDTVGQFMGRTANEDVVLGGSEVKAGQTVMIGIGAANRDPDAFPDPDKFDLGRAEANQSVRFSSFGSGRHRCLGTHLAMANLPIMLKAVLERLPGLRVDWDNAQRHPSIATRGYDVLPVTWDA